MNMGIVFISARPAAESFGAAQVALLLGTGTQELL